MVSFKEFIEENNFPSWVLEEKILLVPVVRSNDSIIHADFFGCPVIESLGSDFSHYGFYAELFSNFYDTYDKAGFEKVSFNHILNNLNVYCNKCAIDAPLDSDYLQQSLLPMLRTLNKCFNHLNKIDSGSFNFDNAKHVFNDLFALNTLVVDLPQWVSLRNFEDECVSKISEVFFENGFSLEKVRSFACEVVAEQLFSFENNVSSVDGVVHQLLQKQKEAFVEEFKSNESFVIFKSNQGAVSLLGLESDYYGSLEFLRLFFYPGFKLGSFSVLPYPEFMALKYIVKENEFFETKSVMVNFKPTRLLLEQMNSLFDENNPVMSNYQSLFEIANTV